MVPAALLRLDFASTKGGMGWWWAGLALSALMVVVHALAGMNSAGVADFWRDMYWATVIANGERFPLAGPQIYGLFELGPWWYYLLALPMWSTGSVAWTSAFAQVLAAAKYPMAWRLGLRIAGPRCGFALSAATVVAGWAMLPLMFPSHTGLVETTVLLLVFATWRAWNRFGAAEAILLGLAGAACLHAHPTTLGHVALAGTLLLWRHRSIATACWMLVAVGIVIACLLPPWFAKDAQALKSISGYLGGDVAIAPAMRIPAVLRSVLAGGAWWGLLLMTSWSATSATAGWAVLCVCTLVAGLGLPRLHRRAPSLARLGVAALVWLLVQVAFVVLLRPVTPMWMIPSCLPPLIIASGLGWYGWIGDARAFFRVLGASALCLQLMLSLAPFSIMLRDPASVRVMPGVNPFYDVVESSNRYVYASVPFYPVRRLDRLAHAMCGPAVLHARLASITESSFDVASRNACGAWPDHRYGGKAGRGPHVAGLLPRMATATGVVPTRVMAHLALYENVRPIAPAEGGSPAPLRRLQIGPEGGTGDMRDIVIEFEARGGDVIVLTNRLPMAAPLEQRRIDANGHPAVMRAEDGGSFAFGCVACDPGKPAAWRLDLFGIEENLDLVVLESDLAAGP